VIRSYRGLLDDFCDGAIGGIIKNGCLIISSAEAESEPILVMTEPASVGEMNESACAWGVFEGGRVVDDIRPIKRWGRRLGGGFVARASECSGGSGQRELRNYCRIHDDAHSLYPLTFVRSERELRGRSCLVMKVVQSAKVQSSSSRLNWCLVTNDHWRALRNEGGSGLN